MINVTSSLGNIVTTSRDLLVLTCIQNDMVTGPLGTKEAQEALPRIIDFMKKFKGVKILIQKTCFTDYPETLDGRNCPTVHVVNGTKGHKIVPEVMALFNAADTAVIEKPSLGSIENKLWKKRISLHEVLLEGSYDNIYFGGFRTGTCLLADAVIAKTTCPATPIHILGPLCACATPESHEAALKAMDLLQMDVIVNK